MNKTKAIYAGSFDPLTEGHFHIIQKATWLFDEVVVLVVQNPGKSQGMFTIQERCEMIEKILIDYEMTETTVATIAGEFVVDYAVKNEAKYLIRGLPTVADFQFEYELYHNNRRINDVVETVFLMCDKDVQQVRSSTVKSMVGYKGWVNVVKPMVHKAVLDGLMKKVMKKKWDELTAEIYQVVVLRDSFKEEEWKKLCKRYEKRPYHSLFHIHKMLTDYEDGKPQHQDWDERCDKAMKFAIWYHDLFLPTDSDFQENELTAEQQSAKYAWQSMKRMGFDENFADMVGNLIEVTDHKKREPETVGEKLIVLLDLLILSVDFEEYCDYVNGVKKEYLRIISEKDWNDGRKVMLEMMIDRPNLFPSEYFRKEEFHAKDNMRKELKGEVHDKKEEE